MAFKSGRSAVVRTADVPILSAARRFASRAISTGTQNNLTHLERWIHWPDDLLMDDRVLLCDAQTSGGLLLAVPEERKADLTAALQAEDCLTAVEIGRMESGEPGHIRVVGG